MSEEIFETPSSTPNFQTELADRLASLVPEVVADGKIDLSKLQELLANDVAETSERFGLFWPGKQRALRAAQIPTTFTLKPEPGDSKNWETTKNIFIEGENLETLKILQKHYHGLIKMIYIDPPYNTGQDLIYQDNYKDGISNYLEWTSQVNDEGKKVSSNPETGGRFHSNWLTMMYPRLKLAKDLLAENGAIVVHIDEHEAHNLERIMCEIFGESNNLGTIVWDKRNPKGDSVGVSQQHELILLFCKNKEIFAKEVEFKRPKPNAPTMLAAAKKFFTQSTGNSKDTQIKFRAWMKENSNLSGGEMAYDSIDDNGDVYQSVSMAWPNRKEAPEDYKVPLVHPDTGKYCPIPPRGWRFPSSTMEQLLKDGQVLFGKDETTQPRRKYLLKENLKENVASLLYFGGSDDSLLRSMGIPFDNPKPVHVAKQLISAITTGSDLILDFFAGSGTTAHAIYELNKEDKGSRNFILVQLPEPTKEKSTERQMGFSKISQITRTRIEKSAELLEGQSAAKSQTEMNHQDLGFRSFVLTESNFAKWRISGDVSKSELETYLFNMRESSGGQGQGENLLFEILLKQGHSLSETYAVASIAGLSLFSVGNGEVMAYVDEQQKPNLDSLREVLDDSPAKFIILEGAFHGDDELKTNLKQLCKSKKIELWTA